MIIELVSYDNNIVDNNEKENKDGNSYREKWESLSDEAKTLLKEDEDDDSVNEFRDEYVNLMTNYSSTLVPFIDGPAFEAVEPITPENPDPSNPVNPSTPTVPATPDAKKEDNNGWVAPTVIIISVVLVAAITLAVVVIFRKKKKNLGN